MERGRREEVRTEHGVCLRLWGTIAVVSHVAPLLGNLLLADTGAGATTRSAGYLPVAGATPDDGFVTRS
jgi:hypothetical protein